MHDILYRVYIAIVQLSKAMRKEVYVASPQHINTKETFLEHYYHVSIGICHKQNTIMYINTKSEY